MIFLEIGVFVVVQSSSWYSGCEWDTGARPYQVCKGERRKDLGLHSNRMF
jgi:hypothetical protein